MPDNDLKALVNEIAVRFDVGFDRYPNLFTEKEQYNLLRVDTGKENIRIKVQRQSDDKVFLFTMTAQEI